jgi:hypothetical protein
LCHCTDDDSTEKKENFTKFSPQIVFYRVYIHCVISLKFTDFQVLLS